MTPTLLDAHRARQLQTLGASVLRIGLAFLLALFGTFKFFQFEAGKSMPAATGFVISPRVFALIMIGTGLVALMLSTIEHRRNIKAFVPEPGEAHASVAGVLAAMIAFMGLAAFAAALFRG